MPSFLFLVVVASYRSLPTPSQLRRRASIFLAKFRGRLQTAMWKREFMVKICFKSPSFTSSKPKRLLAWLKTVNFSLFRRSLGVRMLLEPRRTIINLDCFVKECGKQQVIFRNTLNLVCPQLDFYLSIIGKHQVGMMPLLFCHGSKGIHGIQGGLKVACHEFA
jgi:hypothetical protein